MHVYPTIYPFVLHCDALIWVSYKLHFPEFSSLWGSELRLAKRRKFMILRLLLWSLKLPLPDRYFPGLCHNCIRLNSYHKSLFPVTDPWLICPSTVDVHLGCFQVFSLGLLETMLLLVFVPWTILFSQGWIQNFWSLKLIQIGRFALAHACAYIHTHKHTHN